MNREKAITGALSKVRHPLESSPTLPPACYHDGDWMQKELESIFHRSWMCVGRCDRAKQPGSFFVMDIGKASLVILRDNKDQLRAYANTCSHRGMRLLNGEGRCRLLVCPFHAWSYDLDGKLHAAPRMETCENFDPEDFRLPEIPLQTLGGFAFVNFDGEAESLEQWLGDFPEHHAPWSLERMITTRIREFEVDCNWKAFLEVFNEYYHLPLVHPDTLSSFYLEPDPPESVAGNYVTQFGKTEGAAAILKKDQDRALPTISGLVGRHAFGTRYTWVFPALTFAVSNDSFWMYQAFPLAPDRCRVIQTVAFPEASTELPEFEEKSARYYERIDTALDEDIPFLLQQQAGLSSPFARQGRFSALEPCVGHFACWYSRRMLDGPPKK